MVRRSIHAAGQPAAMPIIGDELLAFLNRLLETEREVTKILSLLMGQNGAPEGNPLLAQLAQDETRCCALLSCAIRGLGGVPVKSIVPLPDHRTAADELLDQLTLLNRMQALAIAQLETMLPRVENEVLSDQLTEMRDTHRANIAACGILLDCLSDRPISN